MEPDDRRSQRKRGERQRTPRRKFSIGPTVELVPANGTVTLKPPSTGTGTDYHEDEGLEAQQSLFSWAEFMAEEPMETEGPYAASPRPQPCRCSSGHWSRRREAQPVGVER